MYDSLCVCCVFSFYFAMLFFLMNFEMKITFFFKLWTLHCMKGFTALSPQKNVRDTRKSSLLSNKKSCMKSVCKGGGGDKAIVDVPPPAWMEAKSSSNLWRG